VLVHLWSELYQAALDSDLAKFACLAGEYFALGPSLMPFSWSSALRLAVDLCGNVSAELKDRLEAAEAGRESLAVP
jgi:hypothetical protein